MAMLTMAVAAIAMGPALPKLSVRGMDLVDPKGKTVLLKGCNLGNWLVLESWMLNMSEPPRNFSDQYDLETTLQKRFGQAEKDRLMDVYRSSWITERDFPIIKSFGFNVVRLPMNYRLFEDDAKPMVLKKGAWKWIDKAIDLAEKYGIYTILDMHGAQGGQSTYDHTGHSDQNKLWSVESNQERLAWLWGQIAKRYRDRTAVVAYDVFNEPYGGSKTDQVKVFRKALAAIRKNDPEKLVYAHGNYDDFTHYGKPKDNGWHNVGFEMHYYPGLFGNGAPTAATHAKHLESLDTEVAPKVKEFGAPFLIGEMNVVFGEAGGASMMRRTYDMHAKHGWATTMWAYKVSSGEGGIGGSTWAMVTNKKPARLIDPHKATKQEIEAWMKGFATDEYVVYDALRAMMTAKNPILPPLPELPKKRTSVAYHDVLEGWSVTDLGETRRGGQRKGTGDAFTLYGGGSDIWGTSDQGRFAYHQVEGDFDLTVTLNGMDKIEEYSKAGLLARESLAPDSAAHLISVFPSGSVQFATRATTGASMQGGTAQDSSLPVRLRLHRVGTKLTASFASGNEPWRVLGSAQVTADTLLVGPIALSHDNSQLIAVEYEALRLSGG